MKLTIQDQLFNLSQLTSPGFTQVSQDVLRWLSLPCTRFSWNNNWLTQPKGSHVTESFVSCCSIHGKDNEIWINSCRFISSEWLKWWIDISSIVSNNICIVVSIDTRHTRQVRSLVSRGDWIMFFQKQLRGRKVAVFIVKVKWSIKIFGKKNDSCQKWCRTGKKKKNRVNCLL